MNQTITKSQLRELRLQELLNSCQQQVLQQVIGPFGLTQAMFEDKAGGNVTTLHNFKSGVTATETDQAKYDELKHKQSENFDRSAYDKDLPNKRKELFKQDGDIHSAYTGNKLTKDGQTHLDHVVAAKTIEMDNSSNLFMTAEQRVATANQDANLVACESSVNQSMQDKDKREWAKQERKKDKGKTNSESFGVDKDKFENTVKTAEKAVKNDILIAQLKKQGSELAMTGAKEAGKNALRQALGILLYEFVNGSFIELKQLMSNPNDESLIERLIAAFKRVADRVISKLKDALQSALQGGVQGFISNLLTFIINSVITTSAKVVTIIREGMKGLWDAIKLLVNPPKDQPFSEVCRQVTKIFAGIVTMGLGMLFEESIKGFIMSIPILLPIADVIALAVTGILTGVTTALVIYGIDRFFDWLSSTGTELLQAQEVNLDEMKRSMHLMAEWIESQYKCSSQYQQISAEYGAVGENLHLALDNSWQAVDSGNRMLANRAQTITKLENGIEKYRNQQDELERLIQEFE